MDKINPRTGMAVGLCSIFLVFGFMFTISGLKGERLGDVPLIALGPAICFPGVVVIFLVSHTKGCTTLPCRGRWLQRWGQPKAGGCQDVTPWDRGVLSSYSKAQVGEDSVSTNTTVGESSQLIHHMEQDEVVRYLQACYPYSTFLVATEFPRSCALTRLCSSKECTPYIASQFSAMQTRRDTIVVYSRTRWDNNLYGSNCCYISPQDFSWGHETVV